MMHEYFRDSQRNGKLKMHRDIVQVALQIIPVFKREFSRLEYQQYYKQELFD